MAKYRLRCIKNKKSPTGYYYYIQEEGSPVCTGICYEKKRAEKDIRKFTIKKLTEELKQIEKEQDVSLFQLGRERRYGDSRANEIYGKDWKRITEELKQLNDGGAIPPITKVMGILAIFL